MSLQWQWHAWPTLTTDRLYDALRLRSDIFVVEQNCVFSDMDGIDPLCEHLLGHDDGGVLAAYLRLVPTGVKRPHSLEPAPPGPALGRVVVDARYRGGGLGRELMLHGLAACAKRYPGQAVFISAQQRLQRFYQSLGFVAIGEPFMEDGLLHVDMRRAAILEA